MPAATAGASSSRPRAGIHSTAPDIAMPVQAFPAWHGFRTGSLRSSYDRIDFSATRTTFGFEFLKATVIWSVKKICKVPAKRSTGAFRKHKKPRRSGVFTKAVADLLSSSQWPATVPGGLAIRLGGNASYIISYR